MVHDLLNTALLECFFSRKKKGKTKKEFVVNQKSRKRASDPKGSLDFSVLFLLYKTRGISFFFRKKRLLNNHAASSVCALQLGELLLYLTF